MQYGWFLLNRNNFSDSSVENEKCSNLNYVKLKLNHEKKKTESQFLKKTKIIFENFDNQ